MRTAAIVGRPNVGKSALFNRLAGRSIAIVHDQPGVTRDRISGVCTLGSAAFEIVDTGGIGAAPDPDLAEETRFAADVAIAAADLLLLVTDGQAGLMPLDRDLAAHLRKSGKPVVLVVNKIDHDGMSNQLLEFGALGIEHAVGVSAAHGRHIDKLLAAIESSVGLGSDALEIAGREIPNIAIVGRPNVGKSSLVNSILGDRRTIVSEVPGTTRDAVDIPYEHGGLPFVLIDTAGIRHRSKHDTSVEVFSVMRSERAINRADLCILVLDATQGVTSQDKRIAGLVQKAKKAAVLVLNKWDLIRPEQASKEYLRQKLAEIRRELFFIDYAPTIALSARSGENLPRLFNAVAKVRQHATRKIGTGELNRILGRAVERQPPPIRAGTRFKILYATQLSPAERRPFQRIEFLLFVNDVRKLPAAYESYLVSAIRKEFAYPGLPIVFRLRGRKAN